MRAMKLFEEIVKLDSEGAACALCTIVEVRGSAPQQPGSKILVLADGGHRGTVGGGALEHEVVRRAVAAIESGRSELYEANLGPDLGMACGGGVAVFIDPLQLAPKLIVVGAGHIGRDLCPMATRVGFSVTVVDARPQWADPEAFPDAADVICGDPVDVLAGLSIGENTFVVLVSHSHAVDQRVLGSVLERDWRYLGMIASRTKVKQVFRELQEEGADPQRLALVHSPIGLRIGSIDPAEIAVSILAELIRIKRGADEAPEISFDRLKPTQ